MPWPRSGRPAPRKGRRRDDPSCPAPPGRSSPVGEPMSRNARIPGRIQRHPAVRLRREAWGGFAFHRETGDLLELDRPAFDAAYLLGEARTGPELCAILRARGHEATRTETIPILRDLEARAI